MEMIRIGALLLAGTALAGAQQPKVVNAEFRTEAAGSGLSAAVSGVAREPGARWIGYEVPARPDTSFSVCTDGNATNTEDRCCGEYRLEGSGENFKSQNRTQESPAAIDVLLRVEQGAVMKVRSAMAGCRLNAGGLPFVWLTGVEANDSVGFLGGLASRGDEHLADEAFVVLSEHATPKATAVLASFTTPSTDFKLREKAAFWLGAARGHEGFAILEQLERNEQDLEFRKKLVFDISISHDPAAIDELIRMAHSDADEKVRGEALFWLAQKAGNKAVAALRNAVVNDPDQAVKRKAVFALSQLPKDEAVPQLLEVAQTNSDPAIRKEAIFWLGQTKDPRALKYFEEILQR